MAGMEPWAWKECTRVGGRRCYHCDNCEVVLQDAEGNGQGLPALGPETLECAKAVRVLLRAISNAQDLAPGAVAKSAICSAMGEAGGGAMSKMRQCARLRWPLWLWAAPSGVKIESL